MGRGGGFLTARRGARGFSGPAQCPLTPVRPRRPTPARRACPGGLSCRVRLCLGASSPGPRPGDGSGFPALAAACSVGLSRDAAPCGPPPDLAREEAATRSRVPSSCVVPLETPPQRTLTLSGFRNFPSGGPCAVVGSSLWAGGRLASLTQGFRAQPVPRAFLARCSRDQAGDPPTSEPGAAQPVVCQVPSRLQREDRGQEFVCLSGRGQG